MTATTTANTMFLVNIRGNLDCYSDGYVYCTKIFSTKEKATEYARTFNDTYYHPKSEGEWWCDEEDINEVSIDNNQFPSFPSNPVQPPNSANSPRVELPTTPDKPWDFFNLAPAPMTS
jgi:hypothetical protein